MKNLKQFVLKQFNSCPLSNCIECCEGKGCGDAVYNHIISDCHDLVKLVQIFQIKIFFISDPAPALHFNMSRGAAATMTRKAEEVNNLADLHLVSSLPPEEGLSCRSRPPDSLRPRVRRSVSETGSPLLPLYRQEGHQL